MYPEAPNVRAWAFAAVLLLLASIASYSHAHHFTNLAHQLAIKDLTQAEFDKYVKKTKEHFETWSNDNPSGNLNRFLNDKLLPIAMYVPKGEIKTLKKFIYWLALYQEFDAQPPWYILEIGRDNSEQIEDLHKNFSWERMSDIVKKRSGEMPKDKVKAMQERMSREKD